MRTMRRAAVGVGAISALLSGSSMASAESHYGLISAYDVSYEASMPTRVTCVQTTPAMSNTWACLWRSNPHLNEISALLLQAYIHEKSCEVYWRGDRGGYPEIYAVQCR